MAPKSSCWGTAPAWAKPLLLVFAATILFATTAFASECNSGVLQMKGPLPQAPGRLVMRDGSVTSPQAPAACFDAAPDFMSVKALCTWGLRVRVTKDGIVKMVPLVQATYSRAENFRSQAGSPPLNCKDVNASGLFYPGSSTSASVMLYDDYGGSGLSNLTKTGANQISLTPSFRDSDVVCVYNFTVVQGCVFGIKAPAKPPACPAGFVKMKGRFGISYCTPCPPGTYYHNPSATCKPCAIGTSSPIYGGIQCRKCDAGTFANVTGKAYCASCTTQDSASYTDGKSVCKKCPKGSYPSTVINGQCYRCNAGQKCCTVGWNAACPKCPARGLDSKSYSSTFALETATPSSCFTTSQALCNPKINITVDATCTITLDNFNYNLNPAADLSSDTCAWEWKVPVQGTKLSISDIAKFDLTNYYMPEYKLVSGNFTAAASPYLTVTIPSTKCTLRYRALTAPFAALLGVTPKPSKATSCPAGQYLETKTDTKPSPCLRCPPGTYSPNASTGRKCSPCPAGTYAKGYGSPGCKACPAGLASGPGSVACAACNSGFAQPGKGCKACPDKSAGAGGDRCLGNAYGTICCAGGNCAGQPVCKTPLPSVDVTDTYSAIFQLVSKSVAQPACKNATFLSCLPDNGKLHIFSAPEYRDPNWLTLEAYRTEFTCGGHANSYLGRYTGAATASVTSYDGAGLFEYALKSDSSKGTVTMHLTPDNKTDCSATFKLVSGYAFDLAPLKDVSCDPADLVNTYGGRKFCQPCPAGQYRNSTGGMCYDCPAGTYSDTAGASACKPCPVGYACPYAGSTSGNSQMCSSGPSSKPQQTTCSVCPKNTYVNFVGDRKTVPTIKCTACPKGAIAPEGANVCGVAWDTKFPA